MIGSIQRRISAWLSVFILIAGAIAAGASFVLALKDASESQDTQLGQVAAALSRQTFEGVPPAHLPSTLDDAETQFVIARLGTAPGIANPILNFTLPTTMLDGLQSRRVSGKEWRIIVTRDIQGKRFAVAQTLEARNEDAFSTALFVSIPLALLIPALLIAVHMALQRAFAPLAVLSQKIDRVDGSNLSPITVSEIPTELGPFVHAVDRLLKRLRVAFDQQRRLVSDAAHELRTPVAALSVQAANLRRVAATQEVQERVDILQMGLDRMTQLLEQLLGLAQVQGGAALHAAPVALGEVVRSAVESVLPLAQSKRIDLGCKKLQALEVIGTRENLFALFRNAIDNAVRYTPPDGTVDVAVYREGRAACFIVEDNGPGIDPENLKRVFDPFVRLLGSQETGSGLGLAIAKSAADSMGGTIELSSGEGDKQGLRFVYRQATI